MSGNLKQKLNRPSIWLRLVYMIVLGIAFNVAEFVIFAVVVFQFFATLFTGKPNAQFTRFGRNLARYIQQIVSFMTFATQEKPFPFSPWPDEPQEESVVVENDEQMSPKAEQAENVVGDTEAARPKKPAPSKAAAAGNAKKSAAASKPKTSAATGKTKTPAVASRAKKPATRKTAATRKPRATPKKDT